MWASRSQIAWANSTKMSKFYRRICRMIKASTNRTEELIKTVKLCQRITPSASSRTKCRSNPAKNTKFCSRIRPKWVQFQQTSSFTTNQWIHRASSRAKPARTMSLAALAAELDCPILNFIQKYRIPARIHRPNFNFWVAVRPEPQPTHSMQGTAALKKGPYQTKKHTKKSATETWTDHPWHRAQR